MKTVGIRSKFLYLIALGFLVGILWFLIRWVLNGDDWVSQPYNGYLTDGAYTVMGDIEDRDGIVLATSEDGSRTYATSELKRKGLLHTVGDTNGYISTSVQQVYRSELSGYNLLTGLSTPTGKNKGNKVILTLDSNLCATAYELLGGQKGAVFLYNYETGETLCKVSAPSFDPESVPDDLEDNPYYEGVYLDRAVSSTFTPGSVFKVVTAACAIDNLPDWESETYTCNGSVTIGDGEVTCMGEHGTIGIADGLMYSCNIVFAELALQLGEEKLTETAEKMGFNRELFMEGVPLGMSAYDVSRAEDYEVAWSGVGQYSDKVNPCHLAMIMGAIARDGVPVEPYVVDKITNGIGIPVHSGNGKKLPAFLSKDTAQELQTMLRTTVSDYYGDDMFPGMQVCAKTGTAQISDEEADTAWIAGFSADEETPLAFAVMVEEGGSGYSTAGPIAGTLMQMAAEILAEEEAAEKEE